jgi:transposase, IS5 family
MFCRIPLDRSVPHPTTLMKLTTRRGSAAVDGLNETLLAKAAEAKTAAHQPGSRRHHRGAGERGLSHRLRVAGQGGALPGPRQIPRGGQARPRGRGKLRSRAALGRDEATAAVLKSTGEPARLAETALRVAQRLLTNAKRAIRRAAARAAALRARGERDAVAGRRRGRLVRAVNDLQKLLTATRQIAAQTRQRVSGQIPDGVTRAGQPARRRCPPDRQGPLG